MESAPLVSVLIPNWNGKDVIESCIHSVLNSNYSNLEVIVVDNISTDGSIELLKNKFGNDERVRVIVTESNLPSTLAYNIGMDSAKGEYIFIINNDNQLGKDCIKDLVSAMKDGVGVGSPKALVPSGKIDFIGGLMDRWGYGYGRGYMEDDHRQYDNNNFFYAGFFLFKKSILEKIGFFDEDIYFGWEDLDFSWRVRISGYKIALVPTAIVYHLGSHTLKKLRTEYFCHYHMRKNRIAGLIKNYGFWNLIRFLPMLLFFYTLVFMKEIMLDRDVRMAFTSVWAVWWNIKNLPLLLKKRKIVQKCIRTVPDKEVLKYMYNKSILIEYFLKPKFNEIFKN